MEHTRENTRRTFVKNSLVGSVALVGGSSLAGATMVSGNVTNNTQPPITRTLGRSGIEIPIVSLGKIPSANDNLARAILNSGIVHLDAAYVYEEGKTEEKLGELIAPGERKKFVISSKMHPDYDNTTGLIKASASVDKWAEQLDVSLKRMNTSYVDILYMHAASRKEAVQHPDYIQKLVALKKAGKTRSIGVSAHTNVAEVIHAAIDIGVYDVVLVAVNFIHTDIKNIKEAVARANKEGLGVVAMKVLAGIRNSKKSAELIDKRAALKWVLQDPNFHTAIMTIRTFDELENYLQVMNNITLSENEKEALQKFKQTATLYCSGCITCRGQCPFNVEIPDYMRAYMYAYGYESTRQAKDLLKQLHNGSHCMNCSSCKVVCKSGFNIQQRVNDISRLQHVADDFLV